MRFAIHAATALLGASLVAAQLPAVKIVQEIVPNASSCDSANDECRTAEEAAPFLADAMFRYKIFNINEMAASIALMAFESVDFQYKTNQSPGRPGQGTANMQMAEFNLKYAKSIDDVKDKVKDVDSVTGLSDDKLNEIRALVLPDEYNFASGPWFLTTQCEESVRTALQDDADKGFESYMACVGVEVTDERLAYFKRAKSAFGIE